MLSSCLSRCCQLSEKKTQKHPLCKVFDVSDKKRSPKAPVSGRSLADLFPEIAAQAHGWDPATVSAGSMFKGSWICEKGHTWEAVVNARTGQKQGCPFCAGRRAWPGYNDLATVRSDVAARAVGWDPSTVTQGSHFMGDWRCDLGHTWKAQVKSVVDGQGCAVCAGQQVQEGVNDLKTLFPELAKELVDPDDYLVTANSHRALKWRCSLGHEWEERVHKRTRRGDGCPYCSGHRLLTGFNDVASRRPEIVDEADGWDPTQVYYRSDVQLKWRCQEGHRWKTSAEARAYLNSDCPTCNNFRVEVGVNDLATTHPNLAAQAVGWDPRHYLAGSSSTPVRWRCDLGHEWSTTIDSRAGRGSGCPFCAYKQVLPGFNDLATTHPELASEADGWDPTTVIAGTNKMLSWKCSLGHKWKAKGTLRASRNERLNGVSGCPVCSGNVVLPGFNDLATTHPELAAAAVGWDPTKVSKGHSTKLLWRCEVGHEWRSTPNPLTRGGWCPICKGKQVLKGFNDLATTDPEVAAQAHGWDPTTVVRGHGKKKLWRCAEGHEWRATPGNRTNLSQGCPSCAKSGFDPNKEGYLYFLEHHDWGMFQVGITNVPKDRLATHVKLGWTVRELRGPMDGHLTNDLETGILRALKKRGAVFANRAGGSKFDGWSEAWTSSSFSAASLFALIEMVYEDDR